MLMITMFLRRHERLGISVMFFVFFLCGGEWYEDGAGQWCKTTRGVRNSQLRLFGFGVLKLLML